MRTISRRSPWARCGIAAIAPLVVATAPGIAGAACSFGTPDFGQMLPNCNGGYCYVVSPGMDTSQSLAGSFWSFGTGKPPLGQGDDNGSSSVGNWLLPEGANRWLGGTWSDGSGIDGCITGHVAPGKPAEIMVALITDEAFGFGFFAVASARRFVNAQPEFDFTFVAGGGVAQDISLVEIPRARIIGFQRPDKYDFDGPTLSQVSPGIFGDGSLLPEEVAKGYRIYKMDQAPTSQETSSGWSAITGIVPLGQDISISVPCPPTTGQLYVGYTLVFDSNFETTHVGRYAHVTCDRCFNADQDGDGYWNVYSSPDCCPMEGVCTDCNDLNAGVHPGALEVCNGIDDNCNQVVDDAALPGSVAALQFDKQPDTTRIDWPPLPAATSYDVVRGDLTALLTTGGSYSAATTSCAANDVTAAHIDDADDPDPGGCGFWYLIRAGNCVGAGTFDTSDPSQADSRDAGIAASGHACP